MFPEPVSAREPRVLLVDDDGPTRLALASALEHVGAELHFAGSGGEALRLAGELDFAAVVLDIGLPGLDGFDVARRLKAEPRTRHLPLIFLTGHIDAADLRRGYELGAVDYLLKPVEARVLAAKVGTFVDLARLREEQAVLTHRALHDPLTGLPNRTLLLDRLERALGRLRREPGLVGVLFVDLDEFKLVNDLHGHHAGDRALVEVAAQIHAAVRATDTAARFGGDEFVVLCEDLEDPAQLDRLADRIVRRLRHGATIGTACSADPVASAEELIRAADHAMLGAKSRRAARR